jgi:hypothetical protein
MVDLTVDSMDETKVDMLDSHLVEKKAASKEKKLAVQLGKN